MNPMTMYTATVTEQANTTHYPDTGRKGASLEACVILPDQETRLSARPR